jgi:hypothetical protein
MRIGITLEEKVKSTLKDAAKKLTGPKKRAFMAKVTEDYFDGSARKAETYLGWKRQAVQLGLHERHTGLVWALSVKRVMSTQTPGRTRIFTNSRQKL